MEGESEGVGGSGGARLGGAVLYGGLTGYVTWGPTQRRGGGAAGGRGVVGELL